MKIDLYPGKAQFITGEPIGLIIEATGLECVYESAMLIVTRLEAVVGEHIITIQEGRNNIDLEPFESEFGGYGVVLRLINRKDMLLEYYTAFDVVLDPAKSIRYGFLSDFKTSDCENNEDVSNLRKFHINMVQYYDWAYRHDDLVPREEKYKDLMGKEMDLKSVKRKIEECHQYGMKALGYGAVYAASSEFYQEHREWGMYTSAGEPLVFIDTFYLMDVSKSSPWRKHIIEQYAKAISEVGFDGIHMDTYGFPKTAYSYGNKQLIRLEEEYPSLIEETKQRVDRELEENYLIFNNVGNWPVKGVSTSPQAAVYIEVWNPYSEYEQIKQMIEDAKVACQNSKPVILAAYLEPFRIDTMEQAANAAYLLTASITANGAYHLLLGEERGVLTQGYYVDYSVLTPEVFDKLRTYYDFIVQYMELFYDAELVDVSMTHIGWDNTEYRCNHPSWSVTAKPDTIWLTIREKEFRKVISMINLCGNYESSWNKGKSMPIEQKDIKVQVQIDYMAAGVYLTSPDYEHGKVHMLTYEMIKSERGWVVEFTVPQLSYWSTVWIDFYNQPIVL